MRAGRVSWQFGRGGPPAPLSSVVSCARPEQYAIHATNRGGEAGQPLRRTGPFCSPGSRHSDLRHWQVDAAPRFLRTDYIQHNSNVPTGLKGFMDTFRKRFDRKFPSDYKRDLLNLIGENDMVVIYVRQTWTSPDGNHNQALGFDMFRVQDGKIAEH